MSAAVLREAAQLMRDRAEAATLGPWVSVEGTSGQWWVEHPCTADIAIDLHRQNADHIASWHPVAALAVADWLEEVADNWTRIDPDHPHYNNRHERSAFTVARAYLGGVR